MQKQGNKHLPAKTLGVLIFPYMYIYFGLVLVIAILTPRSKSDRDKRYHTRSIDRSNSQPGKQGSYDKLTYVSHPLGRLAPARIER